MNFGDFHFLRPAWLVLIPIAAWLWYGLRSAKDPLRGWRAVMDADLLQAMQVGGDERNRWREYALLAAWLIAIGAVAGPTWKAEPAPFADNPVPVMVLLKADETMELADIAPNRMERARLKVTDFANERKGKPLGLLAYAGSAHLVLPPTRDTSIVATMASEISPEVLPKTGDDLAEAIRLANRALGETGGSMVVVTDTMQPLSDADVADLQKSTTHGALHFLAIAREETPELDAIQQVAKQLGGTVSLMTADDADIQTLLNQTAKAPVMVSAAGEGTRWAEAGWWLVPLLALISLASFQRVETKQEAQA